MSNLQSLKWVDESDADVKHAAQSALHNYTIMNSEFGKKYEVKYESRRGVKYSPEPATGFANIDDAKEWCWNHYNEKMQPYVKPSPTWIDYEIQKPKDGDNIVITWLWMGDRHTVHLNDYSAEKSNYLDGCPEVYWSLSPFISTMQNLHKGGDCE